MAALNRFLKFKTISPHHVRTFSALISETDLRSPPSLSHASLPLRRDLKGRNVQWVFLGCPGVGKGTYASRLCHLLGVPHIATGDLVREELSSSGPLSHELYRIPVYHRQTEGMDNPPESKEYEDADDDRVGNDDN